MCLGLGLLTGLLRGVVVVYAPAQTQSTTPTAYTSCPLLPLQTHTTHHPHTHILNQTQVRLNGENPAKDFQPCPGVLGEVRFPTHLDGVRVDSWVESGTEISPYYDSLLGKLMVHAPTREAAVAKIQEALAGREGEREGVGVCWVFVFV